VVTSHHPREEERIDAHTHTWFSGRRRPGCAGDDRRRLRRQFGEGWLRERGHRLGRQRPLTAISKYMNTHQISGVTASGETLTVNLTQPASYIAGAMTMDSWSPAPIESEKYLPGSAASAQHMIADDPY
jgi:hypothetical protein